MLKKGNAGVILLIVLLFVLVVAMSIYIVVDKTYTLKNKGSNNDALQESETNNEESVIGIVTELFKKTILQQKGVTGCDINTITTIDSEENLTIFYIKYEIEYNDDYFGIGREANKWTANMSNEILVEKINSGYEIIEVATGGLYSVQPILIERAFLNHMFSINGVNKCGVKLCEFEKEMDDAVIYHIIFDVQSNLMMDAMNGEIKEDNWVENNDVHASFSKENGLYVLGNMEI